MGQDQASGGVSVLLASRTRCNVLWKPPKFGNKVKIGNKVEGISIKAYLSCFSIPNSRNVFLTGKPLYHQFHNMGALRMFVGTERHSTSTGITMVHTCYQQSRRQFRGRRLHKEKQQHQHSLPRFHQLQTQIYLSRQQRRGIYYHHFQVQHSHQQHQNRLLQRKFLLRLVSHIHKYYRTKRIFR